MPIERTNSFHLMLSDDELGLLRLLAEREGLTASDYLRSTLRRLAGAPTPLLQVMRVGELIGTLDLAKEGAKAAAATAKRKKAAK